MATMKLVLTLAIISVVAAAPSAPSSSTQTPTSSEGTTAPTTSEGTTAPPSVCNSNTCKIEDGCRCMSPDIPGGLAPDKTPQMIFIAFDDALTNETYNYQRQMLGERTNPNGCPITMTFFLTHQYTEYDKVNYFWRKGNEFASNSITKVSNYTYWNDATPQVWKNEMVGMNNIIQKYAKVTDKINGTRAPYFYMGGDNLFDMASQNFFWDSSWSTQDHSEYPIWPYTLDFNSLESQDCPIKPCPVKSYPKFWEVPLVDLHSLNTTLCINPASCVPLPNNEDEVITFLDTNFQKFYDGTRAPFGLYLGLGWFQQVKGRNYIFDGYLKWLDTQLAKPDVYVISISKGLEWIRKPTELDTLNKNDFDPWKCDKVIPNRCIHRYTCYYSHTPAGGPRYMPSCTTCPRSYPWVTDLS